MLTLPKIKVYLSNSNKNTVACESGTGKYFEKNINRYSCLLILDSSKLIDMEYK